MIAVVQRFDNEGLHQVQNLHNTTEIFTWKFFRTAHMTWIFFYRPFFVAADTGVSVYDCMVTIMWEDMIVNNCHTKWQKCKKTQLHTVGSDMTVRQWREWRHNCLRVAVIREDIIVGHLPHYVVQIIYVYMAWILCTKFCGVMESAKMAKIFSLQKSLRSW